MNVSLTAEDDPPRSRRCVDNDPGDVRSSYYCISMRAARGARQRYVELRLASVMSMEYVGGMGWGNERHAHRRYDARVPMPTSCP
jgi:hypothetical protein